MRRDRLRIQNLVTGNGQHQTIVRKSLLEAGTNLAADWGMPGARDAAIALCKAAPRKLLLGSWPKYICNDVCMPRNIDR
jgi:hypothetical protein